ncbi:hypothetical protein, partial [Streptacidiphilus sp. EB129]|uniref:hypothetical protein n=1 Tax=Streptacidiphilus sp. EB129 TaxID=3156262 RepID=UPI00351102E5
HRRRTPPPCQRTPSALVTLPTTKPGTRTQLPLQTPRPQPPDAVAVLSECVELVQFLVGTSEEYQALAATAPPEVRIVLLAAPPETAPSDPPVPPNVPGSDGRTL